MLIAKIYVNETQIDEIHVLNVTEDLTQPIHEYKIRDPKRKEKIYHRRSDGWGPLLKRVLEILYPL